MKRLVLAVSIALACSSVAMAQNYGHYPSHAPANRGHNSGSYTGFRFNAGNQTIYLYPGGSGTAFHSGNQTFYRFSNGGSGYQFNSGAVNQYRFRNAPQPWVNSWGW